MNSQSRKISHMYITSYYKKQVHSAVPANSWKKLERKKTMSRWTSTGPTKKGREKDGDS
jgi:hypothetical protein